MADLRDARLRALHEDLCAGARQEGEPAPSLEATAAMARLLRAGAERPADLVPSLRAALAQAIEPPERTPPQPRQRLRQLLALLWAQVRYLPLSFLVLQGALLAAALLANHYLTGFAGPRPLTEQLPAALTSDLLARALWRDAWGRSVDAITLLAPWLGMLVALLAVLPRQQGPWADLEALSPFSSATRLLARAAVATLVAAIASLGLGLTQGGGATMALLALGRAAPLFLGVAWALAWALPFGAVAGAAASLLLWGGLTWWGSSLGGWDLFAPLQAGGPAGVQWLALGAALILFALVRIEAGRQAGSGPVRGP